MVFVEDRRTGLALGEDPEDCRTAGEDERLSRVAEGLGHHRYGVTVLGEAVRGALDLSDAGGADDGVHLGGGRGQADGIGEVAGDGGQTCGSQLRGRGVDRDKARTSWPCCDSFRATAAPINPVAPVTRIFMVPPRLEIHRRPVIPSTIRAISKNPVRLKGEGGQVRERFPAAVRGDSAIRAPGCPYPRRAHRINFLKCRVSMQEFDLDTHHVVVVLAALVRAIVTASAAVE